MVIRIGGLRETVTLAVDALIRTPERDRTGPNSEELIEIEGAAPEYRLTDTDESDPAGRYRIRVIGDESRWERAASADWGSATTRIAINQTGIGFFGVAPVGRPAAYTPSNVTTDRAYDADTVVIAELADIVGTMITDLQGLGLLQ